MFKAKGSSVVDLIKGHIKDVITVTTDRVCSAIDIGDMYLIQYYSLLNPSFPDPPMCRNYTGPYVTLDEIRYDHFAVLSKDGRSSSFTYEIGIEQAISSPRYLITDLRADWKEHMNSIWQVLNFPQDIRSAPSSFTLKRDVLRDCNGQWWIY